MPVAMTAPLTQAPARDSAERPPAAPDRYQAHFWRSPFAVAAAVVLVAQLGLIGLAVLDERPISAQATLSLTILCATLLAAGIWPGWNYLRVTEDGLDQQAGLRGVRVPWSEVQNVRVFDGWAELRVVTGETTDTLAMAGEQQRHWAELLHRTEQLELLQRSIDSQLARTEFAEQLDQTLHQLTAAVHMLTSRAKAA